MHDIAQNPIQVFISPKNIPTIIKRKLIIANILPKVRIGRNSIIGASALVTKDVEPNSVMIGVPAKFIRKVEYK